MLCDNCIHQSLFESEFIYMFLIIHTGMPNFPVFNSFIPDHILWCWIVFHLTFPYVWKYYTWLQIPLLNSFIPNTPLTFPNVDLYYTWLYTCMYFQVLCYIWLHFLLLDSVIPENISLLLQKCTSKVIHNYVS